MWLESLLFGVLVLLMTSLKLSSNWKSLQKKIQPDKIKPHTGSSKVSKKPSKRKPKGETKPSAISSEKHPKIILSSADLPAMLMTEDNELGKIAPLPIHSVPARKQEPGRYVAMDCEFVGVGPGGNSSILARVSIVNYYGYTLLDRYVRPTERVTDWRTAVSGITPALVKNAPSFNQVQAEVARLLDGRILVGHAISHDLAVLQLSHPKRETRDTSLHPAFKKMFGHRSPSLKRLLDRILGISIQNGAHSSVEDAQATMILYRLRKTEFEIRMK
jgi:RNA exonuclease 4